MFKLLNFSLHAPPSNLSEVLSRVHPDDKERVWWEMGLLFDKGFAVDSEFRFLDDNGVVRHLALKAHPLRDRHSGSPVLLGTILDITLRRQAESAIEEQRTQLIYASKMSALGEMAGGIAHEINNPLTVIGAKATVLREMIVKGNLDLTRMLTQVDKIDSTVSRIARIVRGLRTFARNGDSDPMNAVDLKVIVENTFELCVERFKRENIELRVHEIPDVQICCREIQVSQVLLNLLNNAHDAVKGQPENWVDLSFEDMGTHIRMIVSDSGPGIPFEVADKIMQPFFTTKEVGQGTGLGLSISKGIVESHGGRLYLDKSAPYTRFVADFPKDPVRFQKAG
jgi:C4-dicarboxylate-specific signal transduction histidine kinase